MNKNRVVLVTGASKRIGRDISKHFHKKGFNVILHFNKSYKEAEFEVRHPLNGLLGHALHPDYLGNLILFLGMFLLSTGATGGFWSIIGPITMLFLLVKVIIPENKRNISQAPSTLNL